MSNTLPDLLDFNAVQPIVNYFKGDIEILPNELGGSDAPEALRSLIGIKRKEAKGIVEPREITPKELIGKMFHYFWQLPECRDALLYLIYKQTGIKIKKNEIKSEAYKRLCLYCRYEDNHKEENRTRLEVCPKCGKNKWTRHHIDLYTDKYLIEFKTSFMYVASFEKMITEDYFPQINFYMGAFEPKQAIVIYFNLQCLNNTFNSWDELFNKYGYTIPVNFNQKVYDETLEKFRLVFDYEGDYMTEAPCPSFFAWQCKPKNCSIRDKCNNPIEYIEVGPDEPFCSHCRHKIKQDPNTKKQTVPAFKRNGKIYCKAPECEKAVIDAWQINKQEVEKK